MVKKDAFYKSWLKRLEDIKDDQKESYENFFISFSRELDLILSKERKALDNKISDLKDKIETLKTDLTQYKLIKIINEDIETQGKEREDIKNEYLVLFDNLIDVFNDILNKQSKQYQQVERILNKDLQRLIESRKQLLESAYMDACALAYNKPIE